MFRRATSGRTRPEVLRDLRRAMSERGPVREALSTYLDFGFDELAIRSQARLSAIDKRIRELRRELQERILPNP